VTSYERDSCPSDGMRCPDASSLDTNTRLVGRHPGSGAADGAGEGAGVHGQGISGVDLYISTFGPTLSVISEHWPVLTSEIDPKTGEPKPLRPETALDLAARRSSGCARRGCWPGGPSSSTRHRLVPDGLGRLRRRGVPLRRGPQAGHRPGHGDGRGDGRKRLVAKKGSTSSCSSRSSGARRAWSIPTRPSSSTGSTPCTRPCSSTGGWGRAPATSSCKTAA
jgi:hypothetical protein